jgi:hypothetical protein
MVVSGIVEDQLFCLCMEGKKSNKLHTNIGRWQREAIVAGKAYLADTGENPWFTVIISVCAHAQVDLLWALVLMVLCSEVKDRIRHSQGHIAKD